jgi:predicted RNA-binding Zn ribbon-like protein
MVALDAARMLGTDDERWRIRICASETCSGRFFDRSPAGRRRWCSMRTCGNEAKARRHRLRAKAQEANEPARDGLNRAKAKQGARATSSTTTGAT